MILVEQINEHTESLLNMQTEIERFYKTVDVTTSLTRQKLLHYQELKRQAADTLEDVAEGYRAALKLYRQSENFSQKLLMIRDQHNELSYAALALHKTEPDKAEKLILIMKDARAQLHKLYDEIEAMRKEAAANSTDNDDEPDGDL
jgi:hypothetical protein